MDGVMALRKTFLGCILLTCLMISQWSWAGELELKEDYPERYVIVKGDTLWDIAGRFLESPWRWPEIWDVNPDISNPHLIFPGDVVALKFVDGKPVLTIEKPVKVERTRATVKLSPKMRVEHVTRPVATIPMSAIKKFLARTRVMSKDELNKAPYIVALGDRHIVSGISDRIYVKGGDLKKNEKYQVVHPGKVYTDPFAMGNPELGVEVAYVAKAKIKSSGKTAKAQITQSFRETSQGDRLVKAEQENIRLGDFVPQVPRQAISGRVISLVDALTVAGQYQVVVLNRGSNQGMSVGHIFAIVKKGVEVTDVSSHKLRKNSVRLPDEEVGILMVVRTYPKLSYALVMEASKDINIGDHFDRPE